MKKSILILAATASIFYAKAQINYPSTKTADSSSTYWGVTYKDPYRWLENVKSAEVEKWFRDQSNLTNTTLDKIAGRDELINEYKKLDKLQPARINSRYLENGRIFYKKTMPGENVGKLYYRQGMNGAEILLFDPKTFIAGKTLTIQSAIPSFDGKKIVVSYSESGAEVSTIRVMDVDSKTFMPESIYPSREGAFGFTLDNKAFTYNSQKTGDNTDPGFELNTKTKLHILGDDVKNDKDFFSNASAPELNITPKEFPYAWLDEESKNYIFGQVGTVQNEFLFYYAPVTQLHADKISWKVLCKREDGLVRNLMVFGNDVYAICNKNAKNYKLLHTTLTNPNWNNADVIAAEKPNQTLENIRHCKDYLIITYSDGINTHLYKYNFKTKITSAVKMPYSGTAIIYSLDGKTNNYCYVAITSWTKPYTEFKFNPETNVFGPSDFNKAPVYPAEYTSLQVEEVEVKGHDGTMIPLSVIYKKGLKKDGSNVCLMDSYGAYGISMSPFFSYRELALAVKNVVIAIPHVRGGSEKGEDWYKGGFKTTKPNTWKDFNSCAEYLIANGFTSAKKLAGTGTSAGGILISRAITERPDLYAAAICNVGCANALRLEFSPNGPVNTPEFGTVTDSTECKALYEMDGLQHVVKGTAYPAVICVGGWNDPRVIVWQPGKFAAAMQNASSSGKPVLMKVNYDNGHFTEDKNVTFANFANQFAFAMWQCGHPAFQPKKVMP